MSGRNLFLGLAIAGASLAMPAAAQELTGTLKKIKETGTISLGHRDSSVPFSYLDDKQQPVGWAMDICAKVVEAVKQELKMADLQVKLVPVTSSTRIPLIANGTIDLECGSTTNNAERQKQVAFTNTHFLTASRYVSKKASKIGKIDDLKGKTVVSTAGTTNIKQVTEANAERKLGANILSAKDHAEAFLDGGDRPGRGVRHGRHPAVQLRRWIEGPVGIRHLERCVLAARALRHHASARRPAIQEGRR